MRGRYLLAVGLGLLLGIALTQWGATLMRVHGASMEPTLEDGEWVLVVREPLAHLLGGMGSRAEPGTVVVVADPAPARAGSAAARLPSPLAGLFAKLLVKRVAAVGGQVVALVDGKVEVDGAVSPEPWLDGVPSTHVSYPAVRVPPGTVFLLGDNRLPLASRDSRQFGPLGTTSLRGRVVAHVRWPVARGAWRWPVAQVR